jgi:hypothetical protein
MAYLAPPSHSYPNRILLPRPPSSCSSLSGSSVSGSSLLKTRGTLAPMAQLASATSYLDCLRTLDGELPVARSAVLYLDVRGEGELLTMATNSGLMH